MPIAPPVGAAYNLAEHLPERRKMMQAWADYLDSLNAGAEVLPLFKKAWGAALALETSPFHPSVFNILFLHG